MFEAGDVPVPIFAVLRDHENGHVTMNTRTYHTESLLRCVADHVSVDLSGHIGTGSVLLCLW